MFSNNPINSNIPLGAMFCRKCGIEMNFSDFHGLCPTCHSEFLSCQLGMDAFLHSGSLDRTLNPFDESSYIIVKTSFEGFHKYPGAPEEVAFLRDSHRHMFYVEAEIEVFTEDRELEFFIVQKFIKQLLTNGQQDYKSCEMIAHDIASAINNRYGERNVKVSVFEDNENGGVYKRTFDDRK